MSKLELPEQFLNRMSNLLGEEYPSFLSAYERPRKNGLRVNTLKISTEDFRKRKIFELEPIPWASDGFYYDYTEQAGQHPYYAAGIYYLQEPSAMSVVHYLDPQPGEWILDLAAAPGGKTTQIASRLKQQGLLWANEINPGRARILAENLDRWGTYNTIVSNESPDRLANQLPGVFDRILLDAPCSGEGMFRKEPDAVRHWSVENIQACAVRQQHILSSAAQLLKPGGRLVYSTCTFSVEENEGTISLFLEQHRDFNLLSLPAPSPDFMNSSLPGAVRLYPHRLGGEGHFIAVLEKSMKNSSNLKSGEINKITDLKDNKNKKKSSLKQQCVKDELNEIVSDFKVFCRKTFDFNKSFSFNKQLANKNFEQNFRPTANLLSLLEKTILTEDFSKQFTIFGSHLYLNPAQQLSFTGLSILRPGLYLGESRPGRFQPGHALAHALTPEIVNDYIMFSSDDSHLKDYLHGETLSSAGSDGWVLIGVDEFPLGWAKRASGQLKNHLPKELRI